MDDDARIIEWVDANVGGTVVAIRRQPRWRPVWLVDVERDGDTLELMVRGDRTDAAPLFPLEHEMRFQQLLEEAGIPVPHVYGWIDEPRAFVTDRVPGEPHFDAATDAERAAVMDEYMGILARIHALDVEPFADRGIVAGGDAGRVGPGRHGRVRARVPAYEAAPRPVPRVLPRLARAQPAAQP